MVVYSCGLMLNVADVAVKEEITLEAVVSVFLFVVWCKTPVHLYVPKCWKIFADPS